MVSSLTKKSPIGVEVGPRFIQAVQLRRKGRRWALAAWTRYRRMCPEGPVTPEEVELLSHVLARKGFTGNDIVSGIEGDGLVTGIVETPAAGAAPRREIARRELARMHELNPQQLELSWWELPRNVHAKNTTQVMAAGYPYPLAEAYLDTFEAGGLELRALDVRGCALTRSLSGTLNHEDRIEGILDICWDSATLYLVYLGVIVYERRISRGGWSRVYEAIHSKTQFDRETIGLLLEETDLDAPASYQGHERRRSHGEGDVQHQLSSYIEELVSDLKVPFSYVQHEYSRAQIGRLFVAGQAACLRGMDSRISARLELPVVPARLEDLVSVGRQSISAGGMGLSAAVGYAQFQED
jgi:Tfp pilus assembly PilM family ATPase